MEKNIIRCGVVGSRSILDKQFVFDTLDFYLERLLKENEVVIVSGGAVGIDTLSEDFARERKLNRRDRTEYIIKLEAKVELLKELMK
jgi:predicted Rossmann fold nucleotide-binding protein DprA/Smf involved in DNA uptake